MRRSSTLAMALTLMLAPVSCGGDEGRDLDGGDPGTTIPDSNDTIVACKVGEVDGDLYLYNWSDYVDPELVSRFKNEFEVEVVVDSYDSNEALLAKLQSGAVYDLVVPSDYMVTTMVEEELLARIQKEATPNLENLSQFFTNPVYDPGGNYSVPYLWGTIGLGVDKSVIGADFEPSWAIVFDSEIVSQYTGGIFLLADPRQTLGAALKFLGYSLNSEDETELQEAADLIAGVEEQITAFHDGNPGELLTTGDVTVSHGSSDSLMAAIDDIDGRSRYAYVIPKEGAAYWVDNMAVPANAEHPCTAHAFINFLLDAENGAALANWNHRASPNEVAEAFILPEILEDEGLYPSVEVRELLEIIADTGDFEVVYADYFTIARS